MPLPEGTFTVGQTAQDGGLRHRLHRQVGHGHVRHHRQPAQERLRPFLRLQLPASRPQLFPHVSLQRRPRFELPGNDGNKVEAKGTIYAQDLIADETLAGSAPTRTGRSSSSTPSRCRTARFRSTTRASTRDKPWTEQQKNYAAHGHAGSTRDVGRLLDLLVELGIEKNTLVMFAGDNGSSFDPNRRSAGSSTRPWAASCGASNARCTRAACARRPSPGGRAPCRPAASATSPGPSGISCRRWRN